MAAAKVVIKKYGDRRLYDSAARHYVNIEDIAGMIRDGAEVQVVDARSGKDITRVILTQIIMEETRDGEAGLPVKLLNQLIVASDRVTHDFLSWYLDTAFDVYKKAGSALRSGVTGPVEYVRNLLGGQAAVAERDDAEVEELRRRVQELEARLAERPARKTPRKKSAKRTE